MKAELVNSLLVRKYDKPVPRYTSYPTVPFWKDNPGTEEWKANFRKTFSAQNHINGISLYIHLPFCESLCTYCGCNKKITANHGVETEYIAALEKEWLIYKKFMNQTPVIRELHLGGGTPTFFSPANLKKLLSIFKKGSIVHPQHEFSIEGHPNNTTKEHLKVLYDEGFRRISYGVQDNDPQVQQIINRIQPFENVQRATEDARTIGFESVNFDLIYGLPLQTLSSIEQTIQTVCTLRPDRIAFYSYAHVPWTSRGQRLFNESHLPKAEEKIALYLRGKELLTGMGYVDIGMDHFALTTDHLYQAWKAGTLHRNFMGYTTQQTGLLLGLGVSAISDTGNAFIQNNKKLQEYYNSIQEGLPAIQRGYFLTPQDAAFRRYIIDIACKGETKFNAADMETLRGHTFSLLTELQKDGLVEWNEDGVRLTAQGHYFIRNVCSAFDLYLGKSQQQNNLFSKAI